MTDENGNGRVWKIAGFIAVPAYGLLAWTLWATSDNKSVLAQHDERFFTIRSELNVVRVDTAKDVANMQRDFTNLKVDFGTSQQAGITNQNKIEAKIEAGQVEVRNKIDLATKGITDLQLQLAGTGHLKK